MAKAYKYNVIKSSISKLTVDSLVSEFNSLVGKRCWSSARAAHDAAIIEALIKKGVDVSAVCDGKSISFARHIALNEDKNTLYFA